MPEPQLARASMATPRDLSGTTLGRFLVRSRLGGGGMGEVYSAMDTRLNRAVALKRIAPEVQADGRYRERFLKEAERASQVSDQRIAGLYDVFEEKGELFLVMEYVEGGTLRQRLQQPLTVDDFLDLALQCASALEAAHAGGVIHCDIKPENIMLTPAGQVKILDFGLAKRLPGKQDTQSTALSGAGTSSISGTPAYMAPEALLERPLDGRSDIFSLGVVFYEILTGKHPFLGDNFIASIDRILREEPAPLRKVKAELPAELERIVDKMLAKNPEARYATATELIADLERLRAGHPRWRLLPSTRQARRRLRAQALAIAPVVLLIAFLTLTPWRQWVGVAPLPEQKHIVVLPFEVAGGDQNGAEYVAGLSDGLRSSLMQLTSRYPIQVVSRSERVADVNGARVVGANLAVEGTVRYVGEQVRVTWALVDVRSRRQVGGATLAFASFDPFAIEDAVTGSVLGGLELQLAPLERQKLMARGTDQPDAHVYYLRGRGYLEEYHDADRLENAIRLFQRSLEADSGYARAYAGLGTAYVAKWRLTREAQWTGEGEHACQRSLQLDGGLAAAHACLGEVYSETGRYEEAVTPLQRALELDPTSDDVYRGLANTYVRLGKVNEAEAIYKRAITLRPHYWAPYMWLGHFYYRQGREEEAIPMFQEVVTLAPDSFVGYSNLGAQHLSQGRMREAIPLLERSVSIRANFGAHSNLGTAYFYERRFAEAAEEYRKAIRYRENSHAGWGNLGEALYFMGAARRAESEAAYRKAIEKAQEELKVDPRQAGIVAAVAMYRAKLGEREEALRQAQRALELDSASRFVLRDAAVVHKLLGDRERCLELLQRAVEARYPKALLRAHPLFDDLRGQADFDVLAKAH
jgi:tetratricopeptide (TPR) repeat protein